MSSTRSSNGAPRSFVVAVETVCKTAADLGDLVKRARHWAQSVAFEVIPSGIRLYLTILAGDETAAETIVREGIFGGDITVEP